MSSALLPPPPQTDPNKASTSTNNLQYLSTDDIIAEHARSSLPGSPHVSPRKIPVGGAAASGPRRSSLYKQDDQDRFEVCSLDFSDDIIAEIVSTTSSCSIASSTNSRITGVVNPKKQNPLSAIKRGDIGQPSSLRLPINPMDASSNTDSPNSASNQTTDTKTTNESQLTDSKTNSTDSNLHLPGAGSGVGGKLKSFLAKTISKSVCSSRDNF
ncbi:hypothetical protein BDR26DRAFT_852733 [Obelidium mucronatum]|nr:hypothetical protein BDR26DRAFT_852733 [Obelidium mucronatum]